MISFIQQWIEKTYRLEKQKPVSEYLIDHEMVLNYLGKNHSLSQAEEVLLLTGSGNDYNLGLYFHPSILKNNQRESFSRRNHRWLTVTEGISHFLLLSYKLRAEEEVTQLELELQAEIDKFLYAKLGAEPSTLSPTFHLEQKANLESLIPDQQNTYENARRLASRYCSKLEKEYLCGRSYDGLFEELRHFYRMSHWQKLKVLGVP